MQHQTARQTSRESIHDLRNLFGVVASARHMLDDGPPPERRILLLDAIEDAAMRGARLTTELLARRRASHMADKADLCHNLAGLEPLMGALAGRHAEIRMDLPACRLPVRFNPADFDAAVLELVANASAAIDGPGEILIRVKRIGKRVWLMVGDTGSGMTRLELERALRGSAIPSATGTGLGRVILFARSHHGRLRIRSRKGRGTVAFLNLPLVLKTARAESAVAFPCRRNSRPEENGHEKRRPTAA